MRYSVIGATYQNQSLAVFHSGLDDEVLPNFTAATKKALRLLVAELAANSLADIHELADQVVELLTSSKVNLRQLNDKTNDALSISWFADDHFVINVMDKSESYQMHLEVVPMGIH